VQLAEPEVTEPYISAAPMVAEYHIKLKIFNPFRGSYCLWIFSPAIFIGRYSN